MMTMMTLHKYNFLLAHVVRRSSISLPSPRR